MPDEGSTPPHNTSAGSPDHAPPDHGSSDRGPSDRGPEQTTSHPPTGPDALAEALRRLAEAREFFVHLLVAEIGKFKLRLRQGAMWAIAGLTAVVLLLAILVSAAGLLLFGLAGWVGVLLGNRAWLGEIIVGGGILLLVILGLAWGLWAWQASASDAVRESFAARKARQKNRFGRSVEFAEDEQPGE
jgi:hypothetical protein